MCALKKFYAFQVFMNRPKKAMWMKATIWLEEWNFAVPAIRLSMVNLYTAFKIMSNEHLAIEPSVQRFRIYERKSESSQLLLFTCNYFPKKYKKCISKEYVQSVRFE